MTTVLSDEEVLAGPAPAKRVLSDEEVMGGYAAPAPAPVKKVLSDDEVSAIDNTMPPSDTPVQTRPEGGITGRVPLPQPRPLRADVAETQQMPPVAPLEDVPFRAKMKGYVWDEEQQKDVPAPGTSGMLTGPQAYEQQYGRPAREEVKGVPGLKDVPAQAAMPGSIDEAKSNVDAAQTAYDEAVKRAQSVSAVATRKGTTGQQQRLLVEDEVDRASKRLDNAKAALGTTQREGIETETPQRVFGAKAAEAVGTLVPSTIAGAVRPLDAALDAAGLPRGTGIADYLSEATRQISNANLTDPQQQDSLSAKFGSGVGSMAGFVATGAVGKAAGLPQWAASAGAGAFQNAEQFYQDAKAAGATGMQKALSYIAGGVIGTTEGLGSGRVLDQLDHVTGGGVKRYLGALIKSGSEEGFQEGLQQLLENMSKYGILGKDPGDITNEVGTNALIGAVLGMGMAGTVHLPTLVTGKGGDVAGGVPVPPQVPITPEQIAAQVLGGQVPGVEAPQTGAQPPPLPTITEPPAPGQPLVTSVNGQPTAVPTDPNAAPGTVPTTQVETGEAGVTTTVKVTPGIGVAVEAPTVEVQEKAAPGQLTPVEGLYSRVRAWVEERGPVRATAQRWAALVRRGEFTQEEVRDLKLNQMLERAGPRETLTREDVLSHLDTNAITMQEIERRPLDDATKQGLRTEIYRRMAEVASRDPTAFGPPMLSNRIGAPPLTQYNGDHPEIAPLMAANKALDDQRNWTRYEAYTTAGPRNAYVELTLATPNRLSTPSEVQGPPQVTILYEPDTDRQFPYRVIVDGTEYNRTTTREAAGNESEDAIRYAERLRKKVTGEYVGGHYQVPGELVTLRITLRETVDGQPMAVLEEAQGDIHQKGKAIGYGSAAPEQRGKIPDLPLKEGWPALAFTRFLMWAAERGIRHVAWTDADEQMGRYSSGTEGEIARRRIGMQTFYNREILAQAKRWKGRIGATLGYETIPGRQYEIQHMSQFEGDAPRGWESTDSVVPQDNFEIIDVARDAPVMSASTYEEAQAWIDRQPPPARFRSLIIPQTGLDFINAGMPTHAKMIEPNVGTVTLAASDPSVVTKLNAAVIQPLAAALEELIRQLNVKAPITVKLFPDRLTAPQTIGGKVTEVTNPNAAGMMTHWSPGTVVEKFEIRVALGHHTTAQSVWVTMVHELGHIIERTAYALAPASVRLAVDAAFDKYLQSFGPNATLGDLFRQRQNAIDLLENPDYSVDRTTLISALDRQSKAYHLSKTEWFAEQVAKWATSSVKPLSTVEKFFKGLGKKINDLFVAAMKKFNLPYNQVKELNDWLDTLMPGQAEFFAQVQAETNNDGTTGNAAQMGPEETPAPTQPETAPGMDGINGIFNGNPPPEAREARSYADKFNWLYKWMLGIHQVAQRNAHILPLAEYTETLAVASMIKQQIMIRAQEVLKRWNRLGEKQADAVAQMLDDVQGMAYRTADEIKNKIARHPTLQELQAIAAKYGVSQAGFAVFVDVGKSFMEHLARVEAMLRAEANKITDDTKRGLANAKIDKQMQALRSRPYFPAMRFGNYTIVIRDAAKKVIHFETFESKRDRDRAAAAIQSKYNVPREQVQLGFLDKQTRPLLGVPTQLLDLMADKLKMSSLQRDALEQLKFELSPAQSFQHRFQHKKRIQGYSQDFRRAYATYFFHGANHITKAQFADRLRTLIRATRDERTTMYDATKRDKITAYMNDHVENWLDPKSDWAAIRSIAFLWALAYSPAAAMQNLTQTMMTSYPFLAHQFGDIKAVAELLRAGRNFETFYRKGTLQGNAATSFMQRALWQGMEHGVIKETQAPELAGYADGDVLGKGFGGNQLQRAIVKFNEMGSFMFEMAEQVNRRLIFRATLQLALDNPNSKYVRDMITKHRLMYDQVRATMTESEAAAYVAAVDATKETQFQYGREYAPRMFRGKARSVFVFKTFIQSYVMFLANYPKAAVRSLLILGMLGGFMGLPGSDDLKELLKALAYQIFGKDFDLEQEGRRLVIQLLGNDENGREWAELIMHGVARKGFGIPALMDMLGGTLGIDIPIPVFDRSASISAGTLLPIELGKLFGPPTQDSDAVISAQAQKASGAIFGVGFSVYKALVNHKMDAEDTKRWEHVVPRAISSVARAYRVGVEGGERRADGSQLVKYDVRDTQQMAEVFGIAAGYMPYRQTLQRERDMAMMDATKTLEIRRQDIMRQFGNAALGKDKGEIDKVKEGVRNFNRSLTTSQKGYAITSETLQESVEGKAKSRAYHEKELSTKEMAIPVMKEVGQLYPESQRVLRKVKPALRP